MSCFAQIINDLHLLLPIFSRIPVRCIYNDGSVDAFRIELFDILLNDGAFIVGRCAPSEDKATVLIARGVNDGRFSILGDAHE